MLVFYAELLVLATFWTPPGAGFSKPLISAPVTGHSRQKWLKEGLAWEALPGCGAGWPGGAWEGPLGLISGSFWAHFWASF